jgi:hypothetical protein
MASDHYHKYTTNALKTNVMQTKPKEFLTPTNSVKMSKNKDKSKPGSGGDS